MDDRSFDALARVLGSGRSRRQIIKALASGALGVAAAGVGRERASAAHSRSVGNSCSRNADCASGLCVQESRTRKICHCGSASDCPAAPDACRSSVCLAGVCAGSPVVCSAPTICQVSVACDPTSGQCVAVNQPDGMLCGADNPCSHDVCQSGACVTNAPKPAGTACNDQNACTQTDACDGQGVCVGGNPVTCPPSDACHDNGVCDAQTGQCGANPISAGACYIGGTCHAAGAVNPDNQCQSCAPATSQADWTNLSDTTTCDTGDLCFPNATCQAGICTGFPVICAEGSICLNGGCFLIANGAGGPDGCNPPCIGHAGSIIGTNQYICIGTLPGTNCTANADCQPGQACGGLCYNAC